ncbi:MAG: D-arabinono-1,4-lactone oxidase [Halioglobus sp.]
MLNRRNILQLLVSAAVGSASTGLPLPAMAAESGRRRLPWKNWSGSQECLPIARKAPASVAELQELITSTQGVIRPLGAGHSFSPLVPTDGTLVSLSRMSGVLSHDAEALRATVAAGSRLGDIGGTLEDLGQALINMPDIDEQSLAGCLATSTHGTGASIGAMPTFATGIKMVAANGEIISCDEQNNPEIFNAARVSLGSLGVITEITLQNIAPYRLRRETVWREFDEILEVADELADSHRNFEFYYIPFSGMGYTDVHDFTDEPVGSTEKLDPNEGVMDLKVAREWLESWPKVRELVLGGYAKTLSDEVTTESSWKNYTSERNVRFNEMEYHLPREHGLQALREVREALESQHHEVFFPIEVRYVKGDDIWLSPFYQRDTMSIAVHRIFDEDFGPYFKTIEPIFRKYQGRPHWGKLNTLTQADFRVLYPKWQDFVEVRRELDPQGRFLNPYLRELFA